MVILVDNRIHVRRLLLASGIEASAVGDKTRAAIVGLLYHKTLTAEQIFTKLAKKGQKKALTTIRHHIDVLREAGLVEIARIDETRGGVTKYYGTTVRLLSGGIPDGFEAKYASVIKFTSKDLEGIIEKITPKLATPKTKGDFTQDQVLASVLNCALALCLEKTESGLKDQKDQQTDNVSKPEFRNAKNRLTASSTHGALPKAKS